MIDIRHLFDYYTQNKAIDHQQIRLALFNNTELGPSVALFEPSILPDLYLSKIYLQHFAVFSMVAATQGSIYRPSLFSFPVGKYPNYLALVISVVLDGAKPVHERFYQVVVFLPREIMSQLPNLELLKENLLQIVKQSNLFRRRRIRDLLGLKFALIEFLASRII